MKGQGCGSALFCVTDDFADTYFIIVKSMT